MDTSYTYDSLSRLLSVLHQAGTVTLDGDSYTYDNAGNLVTAIVRRSKNIAPAFLQGLAQFGAS